MDILKHLNNTDENNKKTSTKPHSGIENLSRRQFIKGFGAIGGTLLIGVQLPDSAHAHSGGHHHAKFDPDVFISVAHDGLVSIISHRSEMGQGIKSTLPLLIADEMEANWDRVKVVQAIADEKYGSQNTDGSRSVRRNYQRLRQAGATARLMLCQAAAKKWQVKVNQCEAYNHFVIDKTSGRKIDYAELVDIASKLPIPEAKDITLKADDQLRYIGKDNIALVDGKALISGQAVYGYDVELEGQKYAVIARPPVVFGQVKSFDASAALKVAGVLKVVELAAATAPALFKPMGGIAVIADNTWAAIKGRDKLTIEWDHGANQHFSTKTHEQAFAKTLDDPKHKIRHVGDWHKAKAEAVQQIDAEYYAAGLVHAMMEPPAAAAHFKDGHLQVWGCVQAPQRAKSTVVEATGLKADAVTIHVTYLGGGFGRKSKPDFMAEAALLAQQSQWPIKMVWTREDEIRHGYYHTASLQRVSATFDQQGNTTGWNHRMIMHPIGSTFNPKAVTPGFENGLGIADVPYDIPNILIENGETETFQRIGWFRSVSNIPNFFAVGCFIDEIAHQQKQDPKDHLLAMIGKDRHIDFAAQGYKYGNYGEPTKDFPVDTARMKYVIELVAKKAGWGRLKIFRSTPHG